VSRKEKLLDSALKNLKKKQVSKAIADYQKLVELDPKDIRIRQKLAELLSRTGQNEEALEEYEAIGKFYAENDFCLKAIAIYKQIQRMDPSNIRAYLRLAELNQKQGLLGNALAEYRHLVSHYEAQHRIDDAAQILRKMRDLDPSNLNVRAKLVELSARHDQPKEAMAEFQALVEALRQQQAYDKVIRLYEMFAPILPDTPKLQRDLAGVLIEKGDCGRGIQIVQDQLTKTPSNGELLGLLASGFRRQGDLAGARLTFQQLLRLESKNLDVRQSYIECCLDDEQHELALNELEEWKEAFLQDERLQVLKDFYERLRDRMPNNRRVLQTLDSIYALTGEGDKLLDIMEPKGADLGGEPSLDADALRSVEPAPAELILSDDDLLDAQDEEAAADLVSSPSDGGGDSFDFGDLELEPEGESAETGEDISFEAVIEAPSVGQQPTEEDFFDLELELEPEPEAPSEPTELEEPLLDEAAAAPADEAPVEQEEVLDLELTLEPDEITLPPQEEVAPEPETASAPPPVQEATTPAPAPPTGPSQDFSDLMAELEHEDKPAAATSVRVEQQLDLDDIESHYNLGIAYKEMGLIDDAVAEFRKIKDAPSRFVDSHTLLGVCLAEQGKLEDAEAVFKNGLSYDRLNDGQRFSLYYEMGLLLERMDRPLDALDSFQYVADYDPFFRGVKDKVNGLRQQLGLEGDGGGSRKDRVSYL